MNVTSASCGATWGAVTVNCHERNMFLLIISMRLLVPSMKSSPPWRQTRWQDALECRDLEPSWGERQVVMTCMVPLSKRGETVNLIWSLLAVGLYRVLSSGWRWRPLSACCGECVRVTPSSATQSWMRTSPISTLWVWARTLWWREERVWHSFCRKTKLELTLCTALTTPWLLRVVSGWDKQECCVSHLFLGRPDRTESSKDLRLVRIATIALLNLSICVLLQTSTSLFVLSYHCHLYPHPENDEERADVLESLKTRIQDLNNVGLTHSGIKALDLNWTMSTHTVVSV